jgi:hypothetical protein
MVKGILTSRWVLIVSGILLVVIAWTGQATRRSVDVGLIPDSEADAKIICKAIHIRELRGKSAFFDFQAAVMDTGVHDVKIQIRPADENKHYDFGPFRVENGLVLGTVQLGSDQWPMDRDEDYTFQLMDARYDRSLMSGKITARVVEIAGGSQWFVLPITLLASLIQIVQVCYAYFKSAEQSAAPTTTA